MAKEKDKPSESWIWDTACSIRDAKDAPKHEGYNCPLKLTKRSCISPNNEISVIAVENVFGKNALQLDETDSMLVGLFLRPRPQGSGPT